MIQRVFHRSDRFVVALALLTSLLGAKGPDLVLAQGERDADALQIHEHVVTLAGPFFEGRGPGTEGVNRAADYVAFHFAQDGLDPLFAGAALPVGEGFFQLVPVQGRGRLESASLRIPGAEPEEIELGDDFSVLGMSGSGAVRGPLAFVGYSIGRGPDGYRSYGRDDDLDGRIALMLRYEPMNSKGKSVWANGSARWSRRAGLAAKIDDAVARGASAVVLVNPPGADDPRARHLPIFEDTDFGSTFSVPLVALDAEHADALIRRADPDGRTLEELVTLANRVRRHQAIMLRDDVELEIDVRTSREQLETYNVGAILHGSGALEDEYVIIGAHYDHLGYGELGGTRERSRGELHPGADDNASGTAALLLLAEWLAGRYSEAPAGADLRSVVFLAFTAEEIGLIGSTEFVRDPPIDLSRAAFMLNLDMIGRIDDRLVHVSGMGTASDLDDLLEPILEESDLRFRARDSGLGPSDHTIFHRAGLPVLHFFSGSHRDYHTPRDTADLVNIEGIVELSRVVEAIALQVAALDDAPEFAWTGQGEWSPVRLGIAIDDDDPDRPGVIIASVDQGTAAQAAGLRRGDLIVGWDGRTLASSDALLERLARHMPGDEVDVTIEREGGQVDLRVRLRGRFD